MPRTLLPRALIAIAGARELMRAFVRLYYFFVARAREGEGGRAHARRRRRRGGCFAVSDVETTSRRTATWDDDGDGGGGGGGGAIADPLANGAPRGVASRDSRVPVRVTFKNWYADYARASRIDDDATGLDYGLHDMTDDDPCVRVRANANANV